MSRLFGWSYPPGCSGPPEDPEFCEMCGEYYDNCICPECPECGSIGDPWCYKHHGLKRTEEQKFSMECIERENQSAIFKQESFWKNFDIKTDESPF